MAIPNTQIRTSHAVTIRVNGIYVGQIQSWNPQQSRTVTPTYQLNADSAEGSGNVFENVPGNIGGLTLAINRFDLWTSKMEEAWGPGFSIQMLTDQSDSLTVVEKWKGVDGNAAEEYQYLGFWFTSLGRTLSATDNRIVNVNASAAYTRSIRVS
jgi:hypothetical protein